MFSVKLARRKLPRCVWTSRITASFLDTYRDIAPRTFFCKPCRQRTSKKCLNLMANSFVFRRKNRENVPRTFLSSWQGENFQIASELNSKPLRFWTHKSWNWALYFYCDTCKRITSRMHLNPTANSFTFRRKHQENVSNFLHKPCKAEDFQNASELHSKLLRFWMHNLWNCVQNFFCKTYRQRTSKMRLNYMGNTFVFGRKNQENAPNFFLTCKVKPSKMCLDFMANSFVSGRKNGENVPKTFLYTLEADNSKNATELHGKQLCFETQKSGKCTQNVFINFASGQFPKCIWTFYAVTWEQL